MASHEEQQNGTQQLKNPSKAKMVQGRRLPSPTVPKITTDRHTTKSRPTQQRARNDRLSTTAML